MTFIVLTGAGFSRNWGGWLANEAFEYLLGCPELDANLRHLLWQSKNNGGGFEDALAQLQQEYQRSKNAESEKPLRDLQAALLGMFNSMNQSFQGTSFEPQDELNQMHRDSRTTVQNFLMQFDAIFTLNQDLLLERHYLNDNIMLRNQKWRGWQIPGMRPLPDPNPSPAFHPAAASIPLRVPHQPFTVATAMQPYFKLHGSSNWLDDAGEKSHRLLIMGGNKAVEIKQYPVLNWYHQQFSDYLTRPGTRLMVIGYSFGDHHINETIMQAADKGQLRLFIIDPNGVDVLDKNNPRHSIRVRGALQERLEPHIIGASRRSLTAIFGTDRVEQNKVMQFFTQR
jgi:hypothetical protein